jgi:3-oxoacyl-[acyl-carrier protein] reductase
MPRRIDTDRVRELDEMHSKRLGIPIEEHQRRSRAAIPLGRYGQPDELGRAAAFILSNSASLITGATLQGEGGQIRTVL